MKHVVGIIVGVLALVAFAVVMLAAVTFGLLGYVVGAVAMMFRVGYTAGNGVMDHTKAAIGFSRLLLKLTEKK